MSFIFPEDRFDPATASRKTRLQRRILDLMDQGGRWHIGGMFFLIDDLDCFGSQHYLSDTIPELARLGACGVVLAALPLHGRAVSVGKIGVGDARDLAVILGEDRALLESLGSRPDREPTAEGVLDRFEHWCNETNSISMAITETGGSCVGTISLSHIDLESSSAGIGYWITSTRWRQGLCSEAFDLVLSVARKLGLREVHANIETANVASRRIWLRRGAREEAVSEGKARYTILFDMSDRTDVPLGTA